METRKRDWFLRASLSGRLQILDLREDLSVSSGWAETEEPSEPLTVSRAGEVAADLRGAGTEASSREERGREGLSLTFMVFYPKHLPNSRPVQDTKLRKEIEIRGDTDHNTVFRQEKTSWFLDTLRRRGVSVTLDPAHHRRVKMARSLSGRPEAFLHHLGHAGKTTNPTTKQDHAGRRAVERDK